MDHRFIESSLLCLLSKLRLPTKIWFLSLFGFEILYCSQALVSFKKYMSPPLPYFKVNICPFPLPHIASIFFTYLWSFRWPNYIVTLPRYFSFRLPHLNINTGHLSDELDKKINHSFQINSLLKMILDWQLPVSI